MKFAVVCILILIVSVCKADLLEGGIRSGFEVIVEHSFGDDLWETRGSIYYQPLSVTPLSGSTRTVESADIIQNAVTGDQQIRFKKLLANNGKYSLRIILDDGRVVKASVKGCSLLESNFKDNIILQFDQFGEVIGISYYTATSKCSTLPGHEISDSIPTQFDTIAEVKFAIAGGMPKILKEDPIPNQESKSDNEESKPKQEQSFFSKYWMYILIGVLVINLLPKLIGIDEQQASGNQRRRT